MKLQFWLLIFLFYFIQQTSILAQKANIEREIFKVVEQMPRFPGCEDISGSNKEKEDCAKEKMNKYIYDNLKYPTIARENGVDGMTVLQFIVEKDGLISEVNIVRDIGSDAGTAAANVVESFNDMESRWRPGHQGGEPVTVLYTLPVKFTLEKNDFKSNHTNNTKSYPVNSLENKPKFGKCLRLKLDQEELYECTLDELANFIDTNLQYPNKAYEKKQEGDVEVTFTVNRKGYVENVKASGNHPLLNKEAKEVILYMNESKMSWSPGKVNGKNISTKMSTIISFVISEWD